jgi:hypothetical protein
MAVTDSGTWWSYRRNGNVGIWTIEDWERLFEEELDAAEQHFQETASNSEITTALVAFDEVEALGSETQEHMTEAWSMLTQAVDLDRVGYVADGITAMAVRSNVEAPNTHLDSFESLADALSWARE